MLRMVVLPVVMAVMMVSTTMSVMFLRLFWLVFVGVVFFGGG